MNDCSHCKKTLSYIKTKQEYYDEITLEPSLPQGEGPSSAFSREKRSTSFDLLMGHVLQPFDQPFDHLCGPALDLLQSVHIFFEFVGRVNECIYIERKLGLN